MKKTIRKIISTVLVFSIFLSSGIISKEQNVYAASKYITRESFVEMVMKELGFTVDETTSKHPYIDAAIRANIISEKTFGNKYTSLLTKSDASVVLVNADEYLNGETVNDELLNIILEKRISDISSVSKARKEYIVKAYALGFIIGSSDGIYSRTRSMKSWQKITPNVAKKLVAMLKNESRRATLTDDGQLIRTTNLPDFAKYYPYILADFPNDYYDWEFAYMQYVSNGKPLFGTDKWTNLKDYASPVDFKKFNNGTKSWYNFNSRYKITSKELLELCSDKWQKNAERYLNLVFNVNYKTIKKDTEWYQGILETDWQYDGKKTSKERLDNYIKEAIANKTIVESKVIGVDKSSIYINQGFLYIRAYVRYRIVSCENVERVELSPIIFTNYTYPNIDNIELGEWRDCYLDIEVTPQYENCGIREAIINDYFHDNKVVTN